MGDWGLDWSVSLVSCWDMKMLGLQHYSREILIDWFRRRLYDCICFVGFDNIIQIKEKV